MALTHLQRETGEVIPLSPLSDDTMRRQLSANQEERPLRTPDLVGS